MLTATLAFLALVVVAYAHDCHWSTSGGSGRGVGAVYLQCREGRVSWAWPRGALRVHLALPAGRDFRLCLRPDRDFAGAALFFQRPKTLAPIPTNPPAHRCFFSRGGQAAVYIEALDSSKLEKQVASFAYDLQPIPKGHSYDPYEECRPCTKEEMVHAFCSSELVVRGTVMSVEDKDGDMSEMRVKVSKELRVLNESPDGSEWSNSVTESTEKGVSVVYMPSLCQASHGPGEVVIMARRKLGLLVIKCAPRLEEWFHVVKKAGDSAHCLLSG